MSIVDDSYFANSEKWDALPAHLQELFRLCMDSSHCIRAHGGHAPGRGPDAWTLRERAMPCGVLVSPGACIVVPIDTPMAPA